MPKTASHTRNKSQKERGPESPTAGDRRVVAQLRLHHRLVVGHLEERTSVGLQHDLAGLREVLMPVEDNVPCVEQGGRCVEIGEQFGGGGAALGGRA